jgi:MtrB/PioB family decaheme-associated outer membrane protein
MKINNKIKLICAMSLAAQGALAADNYVEVGADIVNQKSFVFGEYNGLYESGVNGSFDVREGDAYKTSTGTKSWSMTGTDVGTTSRNFSGSMSDQGKWKFKANYDELRHNSTDSYQSPLQGNMGGNSFSLPTNFGTINSKSGTEGTRSLSATQIASFSTSEVYTSRKNTSVSSTYNINPNINIQFDYNHLDQSGAKLLGAPAQGNISLNGSQKGLGEAITIILNPTKYKTDTFTLGANWYTEKSYLNANYYGSIFKDDYDLVSFQSAMASDASSCSGAGCFTNNQMSTAPDNSFHQFNLNGGYDFSPTTKLTAGLSYGRNTQNRSYGSSVIAQDSSLVTKTFDYMVTSPATSLDGLVVNTHADLKVTNQTTNDLTLAAGMKYNKRLDKTASKTYVFKDIRSTSVQTTTTNAPYSNSKLETELAADYRITRDQKIRFAYNRESIHRWCDGYLSGAECIASPKSRENILSALYKIKATDTLRFDTGYTYSNKQGEFNHDYIGNVEGTGTGNIGNTNTGKTTVNGGNIKGFESRLFASRQENIIRAGVNWQPIEDLDLGLNGRYIQDKYEALLGVQATRGQSASFDSTYTINQNHNVSLYANWQSSFRDLMDGTVGTAAGQGNVQTIPTQLWTNRAKEDVNAIGIGSQHTGFLDGKMEVTTDLSYSMDKTKWSTWLQYPVAPACNTANTLSCGQIEMKNKQTTFKLTDSYLVSKNGKVSLGYVYQHNSNDDFYYNIYQQGYTAANLMPTNEQAPNYTVHLVTASYTYLF